MIANEGFSCSTVIFRQYELAHALGTIAGLGFGNVDLAALAGLCEHIPPRGTARQLAAAARTVRASGLTVTSINADPGSFNGHEPAGEVRSRIARLFDACAEVQSPRLVLTCGEPLDPTRTADQQIDAVARGLDDAVALAESSGVELVVEAPHFFRLVNDLNGTRALLDRLDQGIRQAWDVSHVRAAGEDPAELLAEFASRVSIVHLRDAVPGDIRRAIGFGDIDFAAVFGSARAMKFDGPFVLELETHENPYPTKEKETEAALQQLSLAMSGAKEHHA